MAQKSSGSFTPSALASYRDGSVALELYIPVPEHRGQWKGGKDLIVATSLYDHEPPIAFDLNGRPITGLSAETPPPTPTLSLVPVETNFDTEPTGPVTPFQTCQEPCSGGGGGGGGGVPAAPHGIYLTHTNLSDTGEDFLRGSPEIEAMLMGPRGDTLHIAKLDCANESRTGARYYNQDDHIWSGNVLVADSSQLEFIRSKYPPGTPWSRVRYSIEFWEDDSVRCAIATDVNTWKNKILAGMLVVVGGATWIGTDWQQPNSEDAYPFLVGLPLGILALIDIVGGNDDDLGITVLRTAWNPRHASDIVTETTAVLLGGTRKGSATLVWRP
jgi:hypothetical protein